MAITTTPIAGIHVPDSALAREATEFGQDVSTQLLFHHSRRVFFWGSLLGQERGLEFDPELLYVGAMFHDLGLTEGHRSTHQRFEIDGADAARTFLERHGVPEHEIALVWDAIALHTTPEIPHRKPAEVQLVTLGVEYDVLGLRTDELSAEQRREVIALHPRNGFKAGIVDAFYEGMRDRPDTAFGTMNTDILEARLPGYVRPNFCDFIAANRLGD
jgi:HD domain